MSKYAQGAWNSFISNLEDADEQSSLSHSADTEDEVVNAVKTQILILQQAIEVLEN